MQKTVKHREAEAVLPPELRKMLNRLVEDYRAAAHANTGQMGVNYNILADLIRAGWQKHRRRQGAE